MEKRRLCKVQITKLTSEQYMKRAFGSNFMNYSHLRYTQTQKCLPCFPFRPTMKLKVQKKVGCITHYGECQNAETVSCTLSFHNGTIWKAPSHKAGECPFCEYH